MDGSQINILYRNDEFLLEIDSSHESKKCIPGKYDEYPMVCDGLWF